MTSRIDLNETYHIDIDDCNWILRKSIPTASALKSGAPAKNAGKMHDITLGYFPRLEVALEHYVDSLEKDGVMEAAEPISAQALEAILLRIEKLCKGLKLVEKCE